MTIKMHPNHNQLANVVGDEVTSDAELAGQGKVIQEVNDVIINEVTEGVMMLLIL